jgi:hypothetical protein
MHRLALTVFALSAVGCVSAQSTGVFMDVQGSFVDGHTIKQHLPGSIGVVPSLSGLGTITAVGAQATGPDDLRGLRVEWVANQITPYQTYQSSPNGPAVFYIVGPDAGSGGANSDTALFATGAITFEQMTEESGGKIQGTIVNGALLSDGQPFITIDVVSFQATQP